jgi:hypothetical protein
MIKKNAKFNSDPTFLRKFHSLLLERLTMIKDGTYTKAEMDRLVSKATGTKPTSMKMDIDPIQISVDLEPRIYWLIQETARRVTGDVMPMDELVRLFLLYFVRYYSDFDPERTPLPFVPVKPHGSKAKLDLFKVRFGRYFKNHVPKIHALLDANQRLE